MLFQKHDFKALPCNDSLAMQSHPKTLNNLDFYMHLCVYKLFLLPLQVVGLQQEKRQHKRNGCIDFEVIDLMVPCDN